MASTSETTTDRDTIRKWAEEHGARPSRVKNTGDADAHKDAGLIRLDFQEPNERFEEIEWDDFFDTMDKNGLAMIIQHHHADGSDSTFNRFVKLADHPEAADGAKTSDGKHANADAKDADSKGTK